MESDPNPTTEGQGKCEEEDEGEIPFYGPGHLELDNLQLHRPLDAKNEGEDDNNSEKTNSLSLRSLEFDELAISLATEIREIGNPGSSRASPTSETKHKYGGELESEELRLDTIPTEMFLKICSFMEAGFLIREMSLVCKKFYFILSNETTWRIIQWKRWGMNGAYPPVPVDENEFCWSRACVKREEQIKLWGKSAGHLRFAELRSHIACVDAVHLFQGGQLLASGSRDRSIAIWDVEKCFNTEHGDALLAPQSAKVEHKDAAHKGWIWAFASNQSHLLSASWDTTVRVWDKAMFQPVTEFRTRVACLCISAMESLVACGTFDRKISFFDPRKGYEPITWYTPHKKPVLALGMDERRVISCGEDGSIRCYDTRAKRILHTIQLVDSYPTCLSFRREDPAPLFYVGDKSGILHLIDSERFEIVKSYQIGHSRPIQGVFHSLGSVITCSRDGQLKIFEPSFGLNELRSQQVDAELPHVHSLYNILALAGGDGIVRLWSPVHGF